jgi:hypothetical protein
MLARVTTAHSKARYSMSITRQRTIEEEMSKREEARLGVAMDALRNYLKGCASLRDDEEVDSPLLIVGHPRTLLGNLGLLATEWLDIRERHDSDGLPPMGKTH